MKTELSKKDKRQVDLSVNQHFNHSRFALLSSVGWVTQMRPGIGAKLSEVAEDAGCDADGVSHPLGYLTACGFLDIDAFGGYVLTRRGRRMLNSVSDAMCRESWPRRLERFFFNLSVTMKRVASWKQGAV